MFSAFASPGLARGTTPEEVSRRLQAQRNGGGMGGMPGQMPGGGGLSGLPGGYAGMTAASQARARAMGGLPGPGAAPAGRMMGGTLPPGWQPPGQGQPAGTAGGMPAPMGGGFGVPQFNQFAGGGMPAPGYMGGTPAVTQPGMDGMGGRPPGWQPGGRPVPQYGQDGYGGVDPRVRGPVTHPQGWQPKPQMGGGYPQQPQTGSMGGYPQAYPGQSKPAPGYGGYGGIQLGQPQPYGGGYGQQQPQMGGGYGQPGQSPWAQIGRPPPGTVGPASWNAMGRPGGYR